MTLFLNEMLRTLKAKVFKNSFANEQQEIDFFRNIKPQVLGKLIYYNKVFRIVFKACYKIVLFQPGLPYAK